MTGSLEHNGCHMGVMGMDSRSLPRGTRLWLL